MGGWATVIHEAAAVMADDRERKNGDGGAAAASERNQTGTVSHPQCVSVWQTRTVIFVRGGGVESQIRIFPFSRLQGVLNPFGDYNLLHRTGKVNKTDSFAAHIDTQTSMQTLGKEKGWGRLGSESVRIRLQYQCVES